MQQKPGEFGALAASGPPYLIEAVMRHDILSDSECVGQVDDGMPESTRHENGLPWTLDELPHLQFLACVLLLYFRQDLNEIIYGFVLVVRPSEFFPLDHGLGDALAEKNPPFVAGQRSVPC